MNCYNYLHEIYLLEHRTISLPPFGQYMQACIWDVYELMPSTHNVFHYVGNYIFFNI